MSDKHIEVLFVGLGNSRVSWYRAALPALALGCDWMGIMGKPPALQFATGYVKGRTQAANMAEYDVIVLQQPRGREWFTVIKNLRAAGKTILYEIDDYVHGIRKAKDHDFSRFFQPKHLAEMELCMRACDGIIASTKYIADRYRKYNANTYVCENGLDFGRYRLTRPERGEIDGTPTVTLMWSGATGHTRGVDPWLSVVERTMDKYPHVCLATIGQDFTQWFGDKFGGRLIGVPFSSIETYPAAMMLGDIALAPAGDSSWYRGKSTLRAMEAAALGIPVIADDHYEEAVVHGLTGFVVDQPGEVGSCLEYLIENETSRNEMGADARVHAEGNFDMKQRRDQWRDVIIQAYESREGLANAA